MRAIKHNMKDQILTSDRKILYCPECDAEYSGNAGDYWNVPDDHVFTCNYCGCELELVNKVITVEYLDKENLEEDLMSEARRLYMAFYITGDNGILDQYRTILKKIDALRKRKGSTTPVIIRL